MLIIFYGGQILLNDLVEARAGAIIDVPPFAAGTLTIGFIFGAYLTETFRGAILAVPRGQMEAAQPTAWAARRRCAASCCRRWCGMPFRASPTTGW